MSKCGININVIPIANQAKHKTNTYELLPVHV